VRNKTWQAPEPRPDQTQREHRFPAPCGRIRPQGPDRFGRRRRSRCRARTTWAPGWVGASPPRAGSTPKAGDVSSTHRTRSPRSS